MEKVIKLNAIRESYEIRDVVDDTLSVGELIDILHNFPQDCKVVLSFDNNYMWSGVTEQMFREISVETREEEEQRRFIQECEDNIYFMESDEYLGDEDMEQKLSKILGVEVKCYDSCIDDGDDSGENNYVMKDCFTAKLFNKDFYVRVFYGDRTREIGCIEIDY